MPKVMEATFRRENNYNFAFSINQLIKVEKDFIWNKMKPKIKNSTLYDYEVGSLKMLISNKKLLVFNVHG